MKIDQPFLAIIIIGIIDVVIGYNVITGNIDTTKNTNYTKTIESLSYTNDKIVEDSIQNSISTISNVEPKTTEVVIEDTKDVEQVEEVIEDPIVYEGMTLNELSSKLDNSLKSTLSGTGYLFASRSVELGLDPYLAVAIVLHETGCTWQCSQLVTACYNVGGQKGGPGCFGGSYKAFTTLEEGINSYLDNLYYNYYALGLTTAETINPKYAESTTWASKINYYINYIKQN